MRACTIKRQVACQQYDVAQSHPHPVVTNDVLYGHARTQPALRMHLRIRICASAPRTTQAGTAQPVRRPRRALRRSRAPRRNSRGAGAGAGAELCAPLNFVGNPIFPHFFCEFGRGASAPLAQNQLRSSITIGASANGTALAPTKPSFVA